MRRQSGVMASALAVLILITMGAAQTFNLDLAQSSPGSLHHFSDLSTVEGAWSKLLRTTHGISMQISTSGLEPGAVHTVWWVVFNNPGACSPAMDGDPGIPVCGEDDIFNADGALDPNPLARISVLWATGSMADMDGSATFSAVLDEGRAPGQVLVGPLLEDARKAEVHLVVRSHGQPSMDRLYQQLNSFEPEGCDACEDVQFSIFQPPS